MATFNLTFRSSFFTGANRIILSIRSKNIRGGGLAPSSEILAGGRGAIAPLGNLNGDVIWNIWNKRILTQNKENG